MEFVLPKARQKLSILLKLFRDQVLDRDRLECRSGSGHRGAHVISAQVSGSDRSHMMQVVF